MVPIALPKDVLDNRDPETDAEFVGLDCLVLALGGPVAALDAEEGRLADVVNVQTVGRSWDLWKKRVM